jgi:hypothetical protein
MGNPSCDWLLYFAAKVNIQRRGISYRILHITGTVDIGLELPQRLNSAEMMLESHD